MELTEKLEAKLAEVEKNLESTKVPETLNKSNSIFYSMEQTALNVLRFKLLIEQNLLKQLLDKP